MDSIRRRNILRYEEELNRPDARDNEPTSQYDQIHIWKLKTMRPCVFWTHKSDVSTKNSHSTSTANQRPLFDTFELSLTTASNTNQQPSTPWFIALSPHHWVQMMLQQNSTRSPRRHVLSKINDSQGHSISLDNMKLVKELHKQNELNAYES
jgi:hypothetical protein